ncbi:36163_t:CDS:1, partial [Racocetra persica]
MGRIHSKSSRARTIPRPRDHYKRNCSIDSIMSLGSSDTTLACLEDTRSVRSLGSSNTNTAYAEDSKSIRSLGSSNDTCIGDIKSTTYIGDMKMYGKDEAQRNDECDRLHTIHFSIRDLWKSNFSAPIEDLLTDGQAKVLDVG